MKKVIALVLLLVAGLAVGLWFIQGWNGAGPARQPTAVGIEAGTSPREAAGRPGKEGGGARRPPLFPPGLERGRSGQAADGRGDRVRNQPHRGRRSARESGRDRLG